MTHKLLENYFQSIINPPEISKRKPQTMLKLAMFFTEQLENFKKLWTKPVAFVEDEKHTLMEEDYWAFEMVTYEWIDECNEVHPLKHTLVIQPHETTWMEVLDRILDEMSKHYGYNIKEQVYYSVEFPLNELDDRTGKPFAGYGRSLNDNILQQLLLAHPEVYETFPYHQPKNIFE